MYIIKINGAFYETVTLIMSIFHQNPAPVSGKKAFNSLWPLLKDENEKKKKNTDGETQPLCLW